MSESVGEKDKTRSLEGYGVLPSCRTRRTILTSVWTLFFRMKTAPTQTCDDITA